MANWLSKLILLEIRDIGICGEDTFPIGVVNGKRVMGTILFIHAPAYRTATGLWLALVTTPNLNVWNMFKMISRGEKLSFSRIFSQMSNFS